ncbi:helix-turn-helix domain-containing protein [Pseudonocardia humida]|uniref:Helix-turn-helix transcriptional regulator n=1 Tax=Pseudonocardia humida TaxID=2800819 RepID=A0ABT1ABU1_9PSEU|nr:XRE family transcriptional regulator [Pseudonocardia humida]MCO1660396.1 helix-turn-helix transcriptional regulator [Pseudonocardia humida]
MPDADLGRAIRALRRERGMTLVQMAAAAGLSQPFLSQLELGRSRPSMRSLFRIASALGTTQQTLLGLAAGDPPEEPVRGAEVPLLEVESGGARLLLHDPDGADVTEFVGVPPEYGEFFAHGRRELLYVAHGRIEVELREDGVSRLAELGPRDSLGYAGSVEHRFRRLGAATCVVLVVHTGA